MMKFPFSDYEGEATTFVVVALLTLAFVLVGSLVF